MGTGRGYLFRACCGKGVSQPPSLVFGRDSKAGKWELYSGKKKKKEASGLSGWAVVGLGKLEARLLRSGAFYVLGLGNVLVSLNRCSKLRQMG